MTCFVENEAGGKFAIGSLVKVRSGMTLAVGASEC